jgi:hypothetical protein
MSAVPLMMRGEPVEAESVPAWLQHGNQILCISSKFSAKTISHLAIIEFRNSLRQLACENDSPFLSPVVFFSEGRTHLDTGAITCPILKLLLSSTHLRSPPKDH